MLRRLLLLIFILFTITGILAFTSLAGTTFTDVTEKAGVGDEGSGSGVAVGDYDNDDDLDIYVSNGFYTRNETNVLYRNNGDGTFTDVTQEAGVKQEPKQGGSTAFFDYDNDGFLDLYVVGWMPQYDILFHNNGDGTFTDVTETVGIENPSEGGAHSGGYALSIFDYNNDGFLDVYVGHGAPDPNTLYRNNGDGTFAEIAREAGVAHTGDSCGAPCDYDNDGDIDIYLVDWLGSDAIYLNNGDGTFSYARDANVRAGDAWSAAWGDYDNDGDFDLYVGTYQGSDKLFRNNGDGTFENVTKDAGVMNTGYGFDYVTFGDYDNDGYLDIYISNFGGVFGEPPQENIMYHNNGDGTFSNVTKEVGLEYLNYGCAAAFLDYDKDGDLDIYMTDWRGANILYRNNNKDNHWLHIKTISIKSNQDSFGAKVKVVAGELSMLRQVGGGYKVINSFPVKFGLGKHTQVDVVEIRWPSGQVDVLRDIPADQFITVKEGVGIISGKVTAVQPQGKQFVTWGKIKQNRLLQNYPNPFNPETWIPFQLAESANVVVSIYDVFGQLVRDIELGKIPGGNYISKDNAVHWDGRNSAGEKVSSGIYFYQIKAGDFSDTRRMLIVK